MRAILLRFWVAIACLLAACGGDDAGGDATSDATSAGTGAAAGAGAPAAAGTDAAAGSGSGCAECDDSDAEPSPSNAEPAEGTAPGATSSSCQPAQQQAGAEDGGGAVALSCTGGGSDSCTECIGEKCCDLLQLCGDHGDCACMALCAAERGLGQLDSCLAECELEGSPPGFAALAQCVATACPDSDECSTPAGFAPPEPIEAGGSSSSGPANAAASIGSGALTDCGFDRALAFDADGEVLQLESADGEVCVRVERRNEGAGSLANTRWTLLSLTLGPLAEVVKIDDSICWYSSHHNFADWAHASSGTRHYDLELTEDGHGGPRTYTLHSSEQGEVDADACAPLASGVCPIGEAVELLPVQP